MLHCLQLLQGVVRSGALSVLSGALGRSRALSGHYPGALGALRRSGGWLGRSRSVSDTIRRSETLWAGQGIRGGSEGTEGTEQSRAECRGSEQGEGDQRGAEGREAASPPHTPKPNRCSPTDTPTDTESQRSESPANFSIKDPPTGQGCGTFFWGVGWFVLCGGLGVEYVLDCCLGDGWLCVLGFGL